MHARDRSLVIALLAAFAALVVGMVVVAQPPASSRAAVAITGPAAVAPGGKVTVQIRVAKGIRGKAVVQTRRGARWVALASRRVPASGRISIPVTAPASSGRLQLRAKVGSRTSKPLRIAVRTKSKPSPSPSPSQTPLPDPPGGPAPTDEDPRCLAQFGNPKRVLEKEHRIRPLGWPQTQPWAVLCRLVKVSDDQEYGCYATDPGTKIFDVFWYYDHAILAPGVADYAPIGGGQEILTGVVGDSSFYIQQEKFDQFYIVWARDGEYDDELDVVC